MSTVSNRSAQELTQPADRLMTLKELAAYLSVNERTLLKLVSDGSLPGVKIGNQWRFRRVMIDAWLDDQMLGVAPRRVEIGGASRAPRRMIELASCFQPRHIIAHLEANTLIGVVGELASLACELGLVRDKNWFVGALIERENIIPGVVGNGVAFLHTMYRHPEQIVRPFMVLGRSVRGVECDALDGKPTHLFLVLGLKFHELHLPWLGKLAQMFARTEATRALLEAPTPEAIFETLCTAEKALFPSGRD